MGIKDCTTVGENARKRACMLRGGLALAKRITCASYSLVSGSFLEWLCRHSDMKRRRNSRVIGLHHGLLIGSQAVSDRDFRTVAGTDRILSLLGLIRSRSIRTRD